ncbi:iron ABC transporter permease [Nocardioides sp.]|jgi:iron(III) transport system permease protein|uniref:ABC transporter permease n=1 Tax=Nocardioides sp. TaxID=35761 RepID=UPI002BB96BB1|nr:iron ABC transporter permease [Nocardioides sp.]HVX55651.1 iron ABC transporter permease [Nocardioides sp.]
MSTAVRAPDLRRSGGGGGSGAPGARPGLAWGRVLNVVRRHLLIAVLLLLLTVLIAVPAIAVVVVSFTNDVPGSGTPLHFIWHNYAALWSADSADALKQSLITSVCGSVIAVAIGTGLAVLAVRTNIRGRWLVELTGITPFFFPPLVGALAWGLLAQSNAGLLNHLFSSLHVPVHLNIATIPGIVFVFGVYYSPYAYLFVSSALRLFDPQLEEAARVHGASTATTFRNVTLPMLSPAVLGAGLISFTLMMENYTIPAMLNTKGNINTLMTRMYALMQNIPSQPNRAAAVGMILLVVLVVVSTIQRRMLRGRDFTTVTGKGLRPRTMDLGRFRWVALLGVLVYLVIAVVLPFLAILNSALRPYMFVSKISDLFDFSTLTLSAVQQVTSTQQFSISLRNTLLVGVLAAVLGALFHYVIAYVTTRTKVHGRGLARFLAIVPIGIPALLMGMGFLWTWLYIPLPIYGTIAILVLAYIARFTPQGFLSATSVLGAVHADLEDSAVVSGASRVGAVRAITAPLMRGGIASTVLLLFLLSMRELTVALFLFTSKTVVFPIDIYNLWLAGNASAAAAISAMYSVFLLIVTLAGLKWLRGAV